ncbi:DUF192 domain-containing protein [Halobium salinum]|uniref:DUF192 domain-containing protein n=1 Tax=Halobium salinum TaxID=1364940 RepID=A0ABD5PC29_9EURY
MTDRTETATAATTATPTATATTTATDGPTYDRETVSVENGSRTLATIEVRIADTYEKRYTGLSDTESLDSGEGMLFVHDEEGRHAYVMRKMDFPLDILFVDANGTITTIHHAPVPPEGTSGNELERYRGTGKYVLEVPMGYANETGIEVGDRLVIPNGTA